MVTVIRTVCAHDCPDMCSLLAHVEDGRLIRVQGDPDQPFTAGFVCAKQGEAWSNTRLACELARRLGVRDAVFTAGTDELLALAFRGANGSAATLDPHALRDGRPIKITPYPDGQRFATPSGKLEFYSAALAATGRPPMPDWHEDAAEIADAARWPLRLLTAPGYFQPHTAFAGNGYLRRREGPPACVLHPVEATQRGLRAGEAVELINDRGRFVAHLQVSDEIMLGVVFVSGQRSAGEAVKGTVNVLCADRLSDLGGGATYQSTYLEVRRAN